MSTYSRGGQVLGQKVGWVRRPTDLVERQRLLPEPLLYPELSNGKVAYPADAGTPADADCCGAVGVQLDHQADLEIGGK